MPNLHLSRHRRAALVAGAVVLCVSVLVVSLGERPPRLGVAAAQAQSRGAQASACSRSP